MQNASNFSPQRELDTMAVEEMESRARRGKESGYYTPAHNAMREAQSTWNSGLGIPKPGFSPQEQRELDIMEMEEMQSSARRNVISGWESGALAAIQAAYEAWERLAEPRPPQPHLTGQEGRNLHRIRSYWAPSHLSKIQAESSTCPICFDDLEGECYQHTCGKLACCKCLDRWAKLAMTCPLCRAPL